MLNTADEGTDDLLTMLSTADEGIDDLLTVLTTADEGIDDYGWGIILPPWGRFLRFTKKQKKKKK